MKLLEIKYLPLFLLVLLGVQCVNKQLATDEVSTLPHAMMVPYELFYPEGETEPISLGGYGSAMAYNAADSVFYLLTDRGPNADGMTSESKVFPMPLYAPTVGKFAWRNDSLVLLEKIALCDNNAIPLNGLPNREGDGVTGEVAYNLAGEVVTNPSLGIDSEGIALMQDGSFWISDEYAPFMMHFDPKGKMIKKWYPGNVLPDYYAKRRPNRGMEGLTVNGNNTKLYGIMQSPLYWPDPSTKNQSVNNRIVEIDLATGVTRDFIYPLDHPKNMVSEIVWVNDTTFLVLERDGKFPKEGKGFKKVFKINIANATNVAHQMVEPYTAHQLDSLQISTVKKELCIDILAAIPGYSHDKPEGIALLNDSTLMVVNDDDFAVNETPDGKYEPKRNRAGNVDRSWIYFVRF